jgi:sugar phosphate isomerase/epimerase
VKVTLHTSTRDPAQVIARCRELGVDQISVDCSAIPGYDESGIVGLEALREYVGKLSDGQVTTAAGVKWTGRDPGYCLNPARHRQHIDAMLQTIHNLGAVGITRLLHYVDPAAPENPEDDERCWAGLTTIYKELMPEAERSGVYLAHHAIWMCLRPAIRDGALETGITMPGYRSFRFPGWPGPFLLRSAEDVRRLIEAVPSKHNGVCLCTGMHIMGGDMPAVADRFAGKIYYAQVRDLRGRWPRAVECFPGTGDVDFPAVIRRLAASGYDGPISPEHLGEAGTPGQDLEADAIAYTRAQVASAA